MKQKIKPVVALRELNMDSKGGIIKTWTLDEVLLTKAEVIGVKKIVCVEDLSGREGEMEVKKVSESEWKKLR